MEMRGELILVFFIVVALTLWIASTFKAKRRKGWKPRRFGQKWNAAQRENQPPAPSRIGDSADQLRLVSNAAFKTRRLLSLTETRVFKQVEKSLEVHGVPWRAMAQVNLGEVLASDDDLAFRAINSKRVDILIISEKQLPVAAIEFQGSGHHQGDAAARDAVKKEALRKAGVGYIEIFEGDHPSEVHKQIGRFITVDKIKKGDLS